MATVCGTGVLEPQRRKPQKNPRTFWRLQSPTIRKRSDKAKTILQRWQH